MSDDRQETELHRNAAKTLSMAGAHSLRNAGELREKLLNALALPEPVMIDAGAAESVDISTIQLLLAAQKSAAARGKDLSIKAAADSAIVKLMFRTGILPAIASAPFANASAWEISESKN